MRLDEATCWERLGTARRAVLSTIHPERGVDAVPVVFAMTGSALVVPVDTVKAKRSTRLQRVRNVERDSRCVLLADHYEEDWPRLWWVRIHARAEVVAATDLAAAVEALAARYEQLRADGAVVGALRLHPTAVTGWQAG